MKTRPKVRIGRTTALLALSVTFGACAHVSRQDLDTRLQALEGDLSEQIVDGDRATASALALRLDQTDERVAALRADLQSLGEEFDVRIAAFEDDIRFDVPVYFAFDRAEVQPRGHEVLARFGRVAKTYYPDAHITVEGFADPSGSAAYNQALGLRRAEAVKSTLVAAGLPAERIRTVSYGEDVRRLVAEGAAGPGTRGWENRRVVLVIDHAAPDASGMVSQGGAR
jgi:peptidoglycan-associated lipoprotein